MNSNVWKRILNVLVEYKLERLSSNIPGLVKNYRQSFAFTLQQKEQHLEYLQKKLTMSDPKLQYRKGWGQVSMEGKTVELNAIEVDQKFIIDDTTVRIEALCLHKT